MGCEYCEMIEKHENVLYEDDRVIALIPAKPMAKGHIKVISKEHKATIQDFDDKEIQHMYYSASFAATSLFENLQAHGTNIIANTGGELSKGGHFHIDVIARMNDDSLNFLWTPKQLEEDEMKAMQGKIKDKCDMMDVKKDKGSPVDLDKKPEKLESTEETPSGEGSPDAEGGEPGSKDLPSEEEQVYKSKERQSEKEKQGITEDKESYLVKQLRRVP